MPRGRPTTYSPVILPLVACAAHFGATENEIADYVGVSYGSFRQWLATEKELNAVLKRGKEASDRRVVESLYKQAVDGNVTACIFWLKNRLPSEWRDVQQIQGDIGHYILADRPMTEEQWIAERATVIEAKVVDQNVGQDDTEG